MNFIEKVEIAAKRNNSRLCVGLDSDVSRIPTHIQGSDAQFLFNREIIDATHDLVCAYKPNSAFYEAQGSLGVDQLKKTCDYLKQTYPEIPIILDAKRGDIGSTNVGYISFAYDYLQVDAITLNPYLGKKANEPFLNRSDKGCIFLCRTSNDGADEFQNVLVDDEPFYLYVGKKIMNEWNDNNNCLLVVGATSQEELKTVRKALPETTFLIPGIGEQGGDLEATILNGKNKNNTGIIINASRSIIFASNERDFAHKAAIEAAKIGASISSYLTRSV